MSINIIIKLCVAIKHLNLIYLFLYIEFIFKNEKYFPMNINLHMTLHEALFNYSNFNISNVHVTNLFNYNLMLLF
jgi:hypothetical protein